MPINFNSPGEVTGGEESQGMYANDIKVSQMAGQQIQDVKAQVRTQQLREALSPILSDPNLSTEAKMKLSQQTLGKFDSLKAYDGMVDQYKLQQQQKQSAESAMFNFFANQMNSVTTPEQGQLLVKMAQEGLKGTAYEPILQNASVIVKPDKMVVLEKPFIGQDGKSVIVRQYNRAGQVVGETTATDKYYKQVENTKAGMVDFIPTAEGMALGLKPYKVSITASPTGSGGIVGEPLNPKQKSSLYTKIAGDINRDTTYANANNAIDNMKRIRTMVNADSQTAVGAVKYIMAKINDPQGRVTDKDVENAALVAKLGDKWRAKVANWAEGKFSGAEKVEVEKFVKAILPIYSARVNEKVDQFVETYARSVNADATQEDIDEAKKLFNQFYIKAPKETGKVAKTSIPYKGKDIPVWPSEDAAIKKGHTGKMIAVSNSKGGYDIIIVGQ